MKLAKIEHIRCGQPAGKWGITTYVWVPDIYTNETLKRFVVLAQKSYLETEKEMGLCQPQSPPGYGAIIRPSTPNDKTVGELRAEYEEQAKAWKDYQEITDKARKPFAWHLNQVSDGAILQFWEHKPGLESECDWGHNHAVTIDYSETKINDYPAESDDEDNI